jgi:hypothetical protein
VIDGGNLGATVERLERAAVDEREAIHRLILELLELEREAYLSGEGAKGVVEERDHGLFLPAGCAFIALRAEKGIMQRRDVM